MYEGTWPSLTSLCCRASCQQMPQRSLELAGAQGSVQQAATTMGSSRSLQPLGANLASMQPAEMPQPKGELASAHRAWQTPRS